MATYYVDPSVSPNPVWAAATGYILGNYVVPVQDGGADNKYVYECTTAGTSGGAEPAWNATPGNTTNDNTAVWTCRAPDSWAKALNGMQGALDLAVAGDIVYCRGTQTLTAKLDVDTNTGANATGFIRFIGCNNAGNVDGTRFIITANGGAYHVVAITTMAMVWWENIEVKSTGAGSYDGFNIGTSSACLSHVFINCCANNCGRYGFFVNYGAASFFYRCVAYSNTSIGIYSDISGVYFVLCASRDNTVHGFRTSGHNVYYGCIAHGNSDDGWNQSDGLPPICFNCVSDGNVDDGFVANHTVNFASFLLGCRITNHSGAGDIGLNCNSEPVVTAHCYFEDNDGDNIQNATLHYNISLEGGSSSSNDEDKANTTEGYVSTTPGSEDFATRYVDADNPSLRRRAITVPWS